MVTVYQYGSCTYSIVVICLISCIFFSLPPPLPPLPPFPSLPPPFSLFSFWQRLTMSPPAPHKNQNGQRSCAGGEGLDPQPM